MNEQRPLVHMLCGLPGCGKTTWYRENRPNLRLSLDEFRKAIFGGYRAEAEPFAHSWIDVTGRYLLATGVNFTLDATHLTVGLRAKWIRLVHQFGGYIICFHFLADEETCRQRNIARPKNEVVPPLVMERMIDQFERPTEEEGFDTIVEVK